jgi:hypothetical protein
VRARICHQQIDPTKLGGNFPDEVLDVTFPPYVCDDATRRHALRSRFINNTIEVSSIAGADPYRTALTR